MVKRGPGEDETIQLSRAEANCISFDGLKHAAAVRAMKIQVCAGAPVQRWNYNRRSVKNEANLAEEPRIENSIDGSTVVATALPVSLHLYASRGRLCFGAMESHGYLRLSLWRIAQGTLLGGRPLHPLWKDSL